MKVGLVGKPNAGKSTFFSAATAADAQIGDYPFTTIDTSVGVAHVRRECPCSSLEVTCEPQDLEISFRLADDGDAPERATTTTTDGAWATVPS
ncbi:MAG: GTPase, partial [Candidatus Thermoplasmatota archaeon]|nr:GTPase [Candidatus Thermoplasmatota archaeon]